jgi:hypothetical protein
VCLILLGAWTYFARKQWNIKRVENERVEFLEKNVRKLKNK